jgi:hypothetical protein
LRCFQLAESSAFPFLHHKEAQKKIGTKVDVKDALTFFVPFVALCGEW